jgi:hypothetical protein
LDWYKYIEGWYPTFWTKEQVATAVECDKITPTQYEEIVGEPYTAG